MKTNRPLYIFPFMDHAHKLAFEHEPWKSAIGSCTNEKIFQMRLRWWANSYWPAMYPYTN